MSIHVPKIVFTRPFWERSSSVLQQIFYSAKKLKLRRVLQTLCGAFHAFGYNSAGSERIWMKFGELLDYGLELSLANFGRDPRRSGCGKAIRIFVFFLSIK